MTGVILFRAQPFHNGHMAMIKKAYADCYELDMSLHVFIGSADKYGTKRNPLPIGLRSELVICEIQEQFGPYVDIYVHSLNDLSDESNNTIEWGDYLYQHMLEKTNDPDMIIYYSDDPRIMLSWFEGETKEHMCFKFLNRYDGVSATKVRKAFLEDTKEAVAALVPKSVMEYYDEIKKYIENSK